MKHVRLFEEYTQTGVNPPRPTKTLDQMGKYRKFKGETYQGELLPLFQHLNQKHRDLRLPDWFEKVQQEDDSFYAKVQSGDIAQPDVRELWRDLTARPRSKFQHVLNPEHGVI